LPLTSVGGQDMFTIKLLDIAQPPQRDDLSMRQGNGTVYVARSTGTAFVNEVWTRWSNVAWQDIRDGDFNGDGLADLSIRHPTSDIRHPTSDIRQAASMSPSRQVLVLSVKNGPTRKMARGPIFSLAILTLMVTQI
jgi:hypothetical protein